MPQASWFVILWNVRTRIKLLSKEGAVLAEASNAALEKKLGVFQDVESGKDEMNAAQLNELVKSLLDEKSKPERSLTVTARGLVDVTAGIGVLIIIPHIGIAKTYYVEEDSHSFQSNDHSMTLKLSEATDITKGKPEEQAVAPDIKQGDIVNFSGGYHYVSSTSTTPVGGKRTAGKAKCTLIAKGAPHPYHLIGESGGSNVYGWVDAGTVSK